MNNVYDMDTWFLADDTKVLIPDVELLNVLPGQTTVETRMNTILAVRNADGTYAGTINREVMQPVYRA